ncbi:hypothetical protein GGQ84_002153 [Desulfitispora alkaliphila]|uniref:hypothetical protein n=1 Tax=Desulfitispora alkaliphila TaxID=622674 RepID=UPI003D24D00E
MDKDKSSKKGDGNMDTTIKKRPNSPIESLKNSLTEMRQIRMGKQKKRTWRQFKEELNKED